MGRCERGLDEKWEAQSLELSPHTSCLHLSTRRSSPHIDLLKCLLLTTGDDGAGSDLVHRRLGHKSIGDGEQGDKGPEDGKGLHSCVRGGRVLPVW